MLTSLNCQHNHIFCINPTHHASLIRGWHLFLYTIWRSAQPDLHIILYLYMYFCSLSCNLLTLISTLSFFKFWEHMSRDSEKLIFHFPCQMFPDGFPILWNIQALYIFMYMFPNLFKTASKPHILGTNTWKTVIALIQFTVIWEHFKCQKWKTQLTSL